MKKSKNRLILKFKKLFCCCCFFQFTIRKIGVLLYFERAKINFVFFFLFKIFLEIFKDMKNGSVSLNFEWTKERTDRKSVLLSRRRASC